ncbi:hypothetical protein IFM89_002829 [Coptis chinensis]|uniref:Protein kinase domain-containing protein n=1 Tax=Coptis chinensis TaxID=261450 RepID=A0A835HRK0_9MAGN|nr:hypothetical protein IFM89_002829 [Coptis chinensis]
MIRNNPDFVLDLLVVILMLSVITPQSSAPCNQSCGASRHAVRYPFGFSESCEVRLNCINGKIQIGKFLVQNVSSDFILVKLPAKCDRPIQDLLPLFSRNYALTWLNGLLVQNCSTEPKGCVVPTSLLDFQFNVSCYDHPKCYSKDNSKRDQSTSTEIMTFANVSESTCQFVYSSIALDGATNNSIVSLEFEIVKLGWWLAGNCSSCSSNANCTKVVLPANKQPGFRCQCRQGFNGDGFKAGSGCHKGGHCHALRFLTGQCSGSTGIGVLVGGVLALVTAGLAILCYKIRRRSIAHKARDSTKKLLSEAGGCFTVHLYTYKEIERATYHFSEKYKLGSGAYGTVYAGKLHNDEWVAIKKIRRRDSTDGTVPIMNEIKLISSVNHPHLVHLLGFCLENGEQILVYEFMSNSTLSQHLQRERGTGLPWTIRLNIATETAHAIAHLHSAMDPPIYHRDIKSSNILLDYNFSSKVADFGLSRFGMPESSHISTAPQGTPGYLDPQYQQNFHLSDKSDVYSFGVVLMEIITGMKVIDFSRSQSEVNLASLAIEKIGKGCLHEIIDPLLEPHRDAWTLSSVLKMAELAFRCLAFHRDMRPSMMEVAAELEEIKLSGWAPLEENVCTTSSVASFYASPSKGSETSQGMMTAKKAGVENQRVHVPQINNLVNSSKKKDFSPVSVHDPWLSGQSSPSTNSFLSNATH